MHTHTHRTEILIRTPPIRRTGRRAAVAENALVQTVESRSLFRTLEAFAQVRVALMVTLPVEPGLDVGVLLVRVRLV